MTTTRDNAIGFVATSLAVAAAVYLFNRDPIAWVLVQYGLPLLIGMLIGDLISAGGKSK